MLFLFNIGAKEGKKGLLEKSRWLGAARRPDPPDGRFLVKTKPGDLGSSTIPSIPDAVVFKGFP